MGDEELRAVYEYLTQLRVKHYQRDIPCLTRLTAACTPFQAGWFGANCCRR